jgi:hypothetical protein
MFDDLHDPAPPSAGTETLASVASRARRIRRRRTAIAGTGTVGVIALLVAGIAVLGGPADRLVPADVTSPPATLELLPTETTVPFSSTPAAASTDTAASDTGPDSSCLDEPAPPLWLLDGSSPGAVEMVVDADGAMSARWGPEASSAAVSQIGFDPQSRAFEEAADTERLLVAGRARAAVVVPDDPAAGLEINLDEGDCVRRYRLAPGVDLQAAIAFTQDWVDALAAWESLTLSERNDEVCATISAPRVSASGELTVGPSPSPPASSTCVITGPGERSGGASAALDGTALDLVMAVGPGGTAMTSPSAFVRSQAVDGTQNVLLIDILRNSVCGGVRFPNGNVMPIGTACGFGPDLEPAGIAWSDIVAVDGSGDAVVFDGEGRPQAVYDGRDPDDPPPAEGEVTVVDGVTFAPDGSGVLVGLCCEPVPGSLLRVDPVTGAAENAAFGRLPAATRYDNVVWATLGAPGSAELVPSVVVGDRAGSIATTLRTFPLDSRIVDLAVVPDQADARAVGDLVLVLLATPEGVELHRFFAAGGDIVVTTRVSDVPWTEDAGLSLAGWGGGTLAVLDRANGVLRAFDVETLSPLPELDRSGVDWISAWFTPNSARFVNRDRTLVVDDVELPGEYVWVR